MNASSHTVRLFRSGAWLAVLAAAGAALAFPPTPHHLVYGLVRDELGNPLSGVRAEVLLEAGGGPLARTPVAVSAEPGVNYRLAIPLDSGATADLYSPSALRPTVPFRMRVRVGNTTYLPIEMTGAASLLTRPTESTRVDLTLGVDSDGDGLPDAWEQALIAAAGGGKSLADIRADGDDDVDGLTNLQEYLAGTYAFDPLDGFSLAIMGTAEGRSALEFTAIRGRSYTIEASSDLTTWTAIPFRLSADAATEPDRAAFRAADTRPLRALVGPFGEDNQDEPAPRFFRLKAR